MLYNFVLAVHILAAVVTVGLIGYTLFSLVKNYANIYRLLAVAIAIVAFVETATGITVAVLSPTISVLSLMPHIVAYLGVCMVAEALIAAKTWAFRF